MDPNSQKPSESSAEGYKEGQDQPWKRWFGAGDLDTKSSNEDDDEKNVCKGRARAVTNMG
ncbi:hypothetical protein COL922a_008050 [Colletotrichum nupharicola]|nr:hypothetical protein COL922a_008050 [Colletotrichum nupharicola]